MPDNELLTVIDERLAMALPLIEEIQENYLKNNGVYAQGLFTHSSIPEEDEMVNPDSLDSSPTDQDETWDDLATGVIPASMYTRMKIDTYVSQEGPGYVIVMEKKLDGKTYVKSHNVGPESFRSHSWQERS